MMKFVILNNVAFAQEAAEHAMDDVIKENAVEHGPVAIPYSSLAVQAFNFAVLFAVLFLLLRKAVKHHFTTRAQTYRDLVDRAENARREAEKSNSEIKSRMAKLEASAQQSVQQAKTEAEQLRAKLMDEAKQLSRKMEVEAQRAASFELEKAKATLRHELLDKALVATEDKLKKSLSTVEQQKLQKEFAEKIEVVGG